MSVAWIFPRPLFGQPRCDLDVSLDSSLEFLEGTAVIEVDGKAAPGGRVLLWLYPNRLSVKPKTMNAMTRFWMYPYDFNPGWMKILKATSGGKDITKTLKAVGLPAKHPLAGVKDAVMSLDLPPGCEGGGQEPCSRKIEITFQVRIPRRYNLFGRTYKGVLMVGGWYPLPVSIGEDGKADFYSPPDGADVDLSIGVPGDLHVLVEDDYFAPSAGHETRKVKAALEDAAHVSLMVFRKLHLFEAQCGGMKLRYYSWGKYEVPPDYEPGGEEVAGAPAGLPDLGTPDRTGHMLDILCRGASLLRAEGGPDLEGETVTIVEGSLRMEIASATESVILVSDRIYDVLPLARFWKFHDLQLLRAFYGHVFLRKLKGLGHAGALAAMEADFCASFMVERYTLDVLKRKEYAEDILKWASFLSSIDYILYSPMVQFREAYFRTIAESDWMRDEPWAFLNLQPKGKLIFEKLLDIVGEKKVRKAFRGILTGKGDLYALVAEAAGEDMQWFFKQWSVAYPSLNYKVGKVTKKKLAGGKRLISVKIYREGDDWVKEPVVVRFKFLGGKDVDKVWYKAGGGGTVEVVSDKPLLNVVIDPEGRLFEDPWLTSNNPKFDNALLQPLRPPVFAGLSIWSSLYERSAALYALFDMRQKYDLKMNYRFLVEASSQGYGVTAWVLRGFGRKLDLNLSRFYFGPLLGGYYNEASFGFKNEEGNMIGATAVSMGLQAHYDTVYFMYDPEKGLRLTALAVYHLNIDNEGTIHHAMSASGRAFWLHSFNGAHGIALYGAVGGTFFDMPEGQLQSLSDRLALRGFEADEARGRIMTYAAFEYRHLWVHNLGINILGLAVIEGIKGVLFGGFGTVSNQEDYGGMFDRDRMYAEIGYGIVLLGTYLGAYPAVLELDVAVPLYPLPWRRKNEDGDSRQPVGIYLSFYQTY